MAAPSTAQRVYFRIEQRLPPSDLANTAQVLELTDVPLKGLIRRVRIIAGTITSSITNVDFALAESTFPAASYDPVGGGIDLIMRNTGAAPVAEPIELFADKLTDWTGVITRGNEGIPFQLTPSSPGSTTGTLYLSWETSFINPLTDIQITIEPLVP